MKSLLLLAALFSTTAFGRQTYYDAQGYMQGSSITTGNNTTYYDAQGYMIGRRIDTNTSPRPDPIYAPSMTITPIPGTYRGITPPTDIEMIGDPE